MVMVQYYDDELNLTFLSNMIFADVGCGAKNVCADDCCYDELLTPVVY